MLLQVTSQLHWRTLAWMISVCALPISPIASSTGRSGVTCRYPLMEPTPGPESVLIHDDTRSTVQRTQTGAGRNVEGVREIVEQMAKERAELASEREMMMEELRQERVRMSEERQAGIRELKAELAMMKADFESERALKASEEVDRRERERMEDSERYEGICAQLGDITNLVQEQRDECIRKKELMDERWGEKTNRRVEKDGQFGNLYDMVTRIIEDREAERIRREEERIAAESRPGIGRVLEELARQNAEQRELLDRMNETWRNESARNRGLLDQMAGSRENGLATDG